MQRASAVALEVELGDAGQTDALDDGAAPIPDIRGVGDLKRGGMAVAHRISAKLAAGELAGDAAAGIDIAVVAFDLRFGAGNQFLRQKLDIDREQVWP